MKKRAKGRLKSGRWFLFVVKWGLFLTVLASLILALPRVESHPAIKALVSRVDSDLLANIESLGVLAGVVAIAIEWPERRSEQRKRLRYEAWQVILSTRGQKTCDLRIHALQDLNQANIDLTEIDLEGARLRTIDLRHARLAQSNFCEAELHGANLTNADLSNAFMSRVEMPGARLVSTNLSGCELKRANLTEANLQFA
ncbi:MAG: pentapeptide repeat-containing protein, partial [Cyanobacteria bacterium J06629_9]